MNRKEIEKRAEMYVDSNPTEESDKDVYYAFVRGAEWMQEQKQAEIDELSNKVSELTEALDASYVFCEGVKE